MLLSLFLLGVTASLASASGLGQCPTPSVQADFDLEKFAGTWYEIESTSAVDKIGKRCSSFKIDHKERKKGSILHRFVSTVTGKTKSEYSDISTPKASEPAKLQITPQKGTVLARKYSIWVLHTDYDNFAITYTCKKKIVGYIEELYILSKTKEIKDEDRVALYDILKKKGVNYKNLVEIDQKHKDCETKEE